MASPTLSFDAKGKHFLNLHKGLAIMPRKVTVGYDLIAPAQKYDRIINAIYLLGTTTKVLLSQFEVETDLSCDAVFDHLSKYVDSDDKLYVAEVVNSRRSYNSLFSSALSYGAVNKLFQVQANSLAQNHAQHGISRKGLFDSKL
ncbi:hypothetical protein [Herbaspirillum sp. NPDC101397]|uniref:hypothetical protein n=1 Tax=Herbaspirillum sp. NPDC101397 TaxID=3364006 RepID=UPI00383A64DC